MPKHVLVVAIRGWTNTGDRLLGGQPGGQFPAAAIEALGAALPQSEVWAPALDLPMFSMRDAESVARELFRAVDARLRAQPELSSVVLLGYSAGSLLARRLFCMAHGAQRSGEVLGEPAPWAHKIDRLVMLAGITRGWEFSTASPDHVRFLSPVLQRVARFVGWLRRFDPKAESKTPFIWQLKRGAPFVVSTRIQYVEVLRKLALARPPGEHEQRPLRKNGLPSTVFLLGARDEFISPADCTELGPREEFVFIELDGSNHAEALQFAGEGEAQKERLRRIAAAVLEGFDPLSGRPWSVAAGDIDDYLDPMDLAVSGRLAAEDAARVEHAVMVVHGIRDNGFWTKRVAREVKTLARRSAIEVRAPSPSYGYFSMWDFVKPGGRERAAYWFMERYADIRSHFPNARVSFVGHSNGTYIAARALQLCSAIQFDRVVFAGSVVRRDYPWDGMAGRVNEVLNYVGNADGVVAFLPGVFEKLRLRWLDVGGAGAHGFLALGDSTSDASGLYRRQIGATSVNEVRFVDGGHSAAIEESFWPEIARFVLLGQVPERVPVERRHETRRLYRWAPVLTLGGLAFAAILLTLPLSVAAAVAQGLADSQVRAVVAALGVLLASGVSWLLGRFLRAW